MNYWMKLILAFVSVWILLSIINAAFGSFVSNTVFAIIFSGYIIFVRHVTVIR